MSEPDDPRPEIRDPRISPAERVYTAAVWMVLFAAVVVAVFGHGLTVLLVILLVITLLCILGWVAWTLLLMRRVNRDAAALEDWYRRHRG